MFTTRPQLLGTHGMVASTQWLAASTGMAVLERDGNAFDAAVAAGLVLQVVEPHLNGPGGEVSALVHPAGEDVVVLGGQGPTPDRASVEAFTAMGLDTVPGTGLLPACVPGAFDAWMRLLGEFGSMRLGDVMSYAIAYARDGFPLPPSAAREIEANADLFREEWPSSAEAYLSEGPPEPGARFRNHELAACYQRLLDEAEAYTHERDGQIAAARDVFYRGFVAEQIDRFVDEYSLLDSTGDRHSGFLSADDLAAYHATLEAPVRLDYHGYTVCKTPAWGQGPVLCQALELLSGYDLAEMGHNSAEYIHTIVEAAKLAFADREAWYGDPATEDVPLDTLLDPGYARERRDLITDTASHELRPGQVDGREPYLPDLSSTAGSTQAGAARVVAGSADTGHVSVADRHGNIVAATSSGGWLQSSPVVPGLGFPLDTRAQMLWLDTAHPNGMAPGKRPRTTLSPSLVLRDGEPYLAFGSTGGDTQDQWQLAFFLAHVHFGLDLQAAIDAPMFHTNHFPSSFSPHQAEPGRVLVEGRVGEEVVAELRRRGHDVTVASDWSLGGLAASGREPGRGLLKAGANPRGMQGYAVGR